jgi:hypothetical protein
MDTDIRGARRLASELLWHVIVLATTLSAASYFHGAPFWQVGSTVHPVYLLCASYVALVVIYPVVKYFRLGGWLLPLSGFAAITGLIFLWLLLSSTEYEKIDLLSSFGLLATAISLFYLAPRFRLQWTGLFATLLVLFIAFFFRPLGDTVLLDRDAGFASNLIRTSVYDLEVRTYEDVVPRPRTHAGMGALQRVEDAYVVAMANGDVFSIRGIGVQPTISVKKWRSNPPLNYVQFLSVAQDQSFSTYFRVTDVLMKPGFPVNTLFVSHHYWHVDSSCVTLRVSSVTFDTLSQLEEENLQWSTVFDTTPCFALEDEAWAFRGMEGGGRLALSGPQQLLLTVGDHGFNGVDYDTNWVADPNTSYGKTIAIDLAARQSSVLTIGHRNQQGLFLGQDGVIWATEHGPEGGDELNVLVSGAHYGWPDITFGTEYGKLYWPVARPDDDAVYTPPRFAWVPAIGISNLTAVHGSLFSQWKNDLLVGSLVGMTMFRVHIEDGVVRFVEPIRLGERIRDIVSDENGVVIWTDSRSIIHILPAS